MNVASEIAAGIKLLNAIEDVATFALIGSASYMPDEAKDVDFAVMLKSGVDAMTFCIEQIELSHWLSCGNEYDSEEGTWCAIRKGNMNLIVTHDQEFYDGYLKATEVCKALGLRSKAARIRVCRIVRDGMTAEQVIETEGDEL